MTLGQQPVDEVAADEPGAAGDERLHRGRLTPPAPAPTMLSTTWAPRPILAPRNTIERSTSAPSSTTTPSPSTERSTTAARSTAAPGAIALVAPTASSCA